MKIPFDIKFRPKIESGEYKVETKDGREVRIVCWDAKRTYNDCICGLMGKEEDHPFFWQLNGCRWADSTPSLYDLFIVTPEPELSEWQTIISGCLQKYGLLDCGAADRIAKECSAELLKLAYQELKAKLEQDFFEAKQDGIKEGIEVGKAEALKDLPRWKKANGKERFNERMIVLAGDDDLLCTNYAEEGEYYISFSDLEKLPKEDEQ